MLLSISSCPALIEPAKLVFFALTLYLVEKESDDWLVCLEIFDTNVWPTNFPLSWYTLNIDWAFILLSQCWTFLATFHFRSWFHSWLVQSCLGSLLLNGPRLQPMISKKSKDWNDFNGWTCHCQLYMMKAKYHLRAKSLYGTNLVLRALIAWFWSGV